MIVRDKKKLKIGSEPFHTALTEPPLEGAGDNNKLKGLPTEG